MSYIVLILVMSLAAHAGWFKRFCERHLIADDPYQFEQVSDEWLAEEIDRLQIKERWGFIRDRDASMLNILRREQTRRTEGK